MPYWVISSSDIKVGGTSIGVCHPNAACDMVVDTGTSLLAGPSSQMDPLISQIGDVSEDCSGVGELPVITFSFGEADFDLGPDFYVLREADENGNEECMLGIQSMDGGMPMWILGDTFLRKYYTVWDRDAMRVGFAVARKGDDVIVV